MILTLVIAALAGWGARSAEPKITQTLADSLGESAFLRPADRQASALFVTLLGAAILLWLLNVPGRPAIFVIGAALGYFQQPLREAFLNRGA